jgi:hypothetical protein
MDRHIQAQQSALDSIKADQEELARMRKELDEHTLVVGGRKVYRDGDHFVDENGERLNDKDEAEAQRLLKLYPDAATIDLQRQLRNAEDVNAAAAQTVGSNIKTDEAAKAGAQTSDQRRAAETKAGDHEIQAGGAAKQSHDAKGAIGDAMTKAFSASPSAGPVGKVFGGDVTAASPGKSNPVAMQVDPSLPSGGGTKELIDRVLFLKPTTVEHGNELGQSNGRGAVVADALPPKGNTSVDVDKGNPKQIHGDVVSEQAVASNKAATWTEARALMNQKVSLTSYASTLSPTPGKGDLTSSFDAALINIDQPQTASADADAKVDKSPLSTEFAAVVTPSVGTSDQTTDDKVTPATPAAQRQTVAV